MLISKHYLYKTWWHMNDRCFNEDCPSYEDYGQRGITVCERWSRNNLNGFENFITDMGDRPSYLSLDRINCNGNYELSNCRWATQEQQKENRRNTVWVIIKGERMCLSRACRELKLSLSTINKRISTSGMSPQEAVDQGSKSLITRDIMCLRTGITKSIAQWARDLNLKHSCLRMRLERGWCPQRAITTKKKG